MELIKQILAILNGLAPLTPIPYDDLVVLLGQAAIRLIEARKNMTGQTTEEILAEAGVVLSSAEVKLLEDLASGQ